MRRTTVAVRWLKEYRRTPRAPISWALTENPQFKYFVALIGLGGVIFGYRFIVEHNGFMAYIVGIVAIILGVLEVLIVLVYLARPIRDTHTDPMGRRTYRTADLKAESPRIRKILGRNERTLIDMSSSFRRPESGTLYGTLHAGHRVQCRRCDLQR